MSKVKAPKTKGLPSKHLHARSTFLYQAATYLTLQSPTIGSTQRAGGDQKEQSSRGPTDHYHSPLALQLGSDLQQVSRKAQLRLSVELKRSLCKICNSILVPGRTSTQFVENNSKGGKKPWADVLVVECRFCGGKKRFPVGSVKQKKKNSRIAASKESFPDTESDDKPQIGDASHMTPDIDSNTG